MQYEEFCNRLQRALQAAGLFSACSDHAVESIDLANSTRSWKLNIWRITSDSAEPFHVSARICFDWHPVDAARTFTCEEDLLTELLGRRIRLPKTQCGRTRIDLELHATLPYGSTAPVPEPPLLLSWTGSVSEKLGKLLIDVQEREGKVVAILGSREQPRIETQCREPGGLSLSGISVSAFQMVRIPRHWDDPDRRRAEKDNSGELARIAGRFKEALDEWTKSVAELGNWIRYSPPAPEAKRLEPWFEEEEDDNGPETIH
jgi:hypothetical protein